MLCDVYGRLLVFKDTTSERMDGVAWTDAGIDNTFDNLDQHEQAFTEIIHTYGYNDGVQAIGVDNVSIDIFGTVVDFSFENGQLVPVASEWQQGETPMFFYRTLNDGTNDVTVVCDPKGKLYVIENDGYLIKGQNGYAWSIGAAPQALVTNAGGKVTMTAYSDEDETTIISMDDYTVVIDLDGLVTVGAIEELPSVLYYKNGLNNSQVLINSNRDLITYKAGDGFTDLCFAKQNGQWSDNIMASSVWDASKVNVEITEGSNYLKLFNVDGVECSYNANSRVFYPTPVLHDN